MVTIFNRFILNVEWSNEGLWWTETIDGSREYHLFDIAIMERNYPEGKFKGLSIIVWKLVIRITDVNWFEGVE